MPSAPGNAQLMAAHILLVVVYVCAWRHAPVFCVCVHSGVLNAIACCRAAAAAACAAALGGSDHPELLCMCV
jgi:hypothetical protein